MTIFLEKQWNHT